MPEKLKYSQKCNRLFEDLHQVAAMRGFEKFVGAPFALHVFQTIELTQPKAGRTPAEKAKIAATKRASKQLTRTLAWLKLDGVKAGGFAVRRGDDVQVLVHSDPRIEGDRVVMQIKSGRDGKVETVDAMLYRPDFNKATVVSTTRRAKKSAAA
jgi:hypothetical protein